MPGEGPGKAICQWYLKGNCRFGHRCALAHILPGQPMSMDRKNKRAAQQQQGGSNGMQGQMLPQQPQQGVNGSNKRLSGQRSGLPFDYHQMDPNAAMHGNGDLMFGMPDDLHQPHQMNSSYSGNMQSMSRGMHSEWPTSNAGEARHDGSAFDGLAMPSSSTMMGGSPAPAQVFGTSPFSHPGSNSVFFSGPPIHDALSNGTGAGDAEKAFGRSFSRTTDEDAVLRAAVQRSWNVQRDNGAATGGEDEHAEEFLPSSLSDLLTPAELERRRRSVLASKNSTLSGAVNGHSISSQSMPANGGLSSSLKWTAAESNAAENSISSDLDPIIGGIDRSAKAIGGSRLGSGTTTNGFFSSRLQSDLTRSRDTWGESGAVGDGARKEGGGEKSAAFSPNFQAVLSHAPGQSLPQGLAAGLSRLHLRSAADPVVGNGNGGNTIASGFNVNRSRLSGVDTFGNGESSSPGVIGGARSSVDDLGPTVPSSIFNQRHSGLHNHFGRSIGGQSASTSFETGSLSKNQLGNSHGSPYTLSPAIKAVDGGIAIPTNSLGYTDKNGSSNGQGMRSGSVESRNSLTIGSGHFSHNQQRTQHLSTGTGQHPGIHRVRTSGTMGGGIGASPLSLPTTGEEVEEAIFELE